MSESEHSSLAEALAGFQAELPSIGTDKTAKVKSERTNTEYSYKYADLADIAPVVLPLLAKHGLSWSTKPTLWKGSLVLKYKLRHESGESTSGIYPLPAANTPAQQLGSAITYARRYCLLAVTGVSPGGDDNDGADAPAAPPTRRRGRQPDPQIATRDWVEEGKAAAKQGLDSLREVYREAELAGELGAKVHADDQFTVAETLWQLREGETPAPKAVVRRKPLAEKAPAVEPTLPDDEAYAAAARAKAEAEFKDAPAVIEEPALEWEVGP